MSDRIRIDFETNVVPVERGAERVEDSLDDVTDALDKVGESGEKASKDASGGLDEVGEAAQKAGSEVEDSGGAFGDLADEAGGALDGIAGDLLGLAGVAGGVGGAVSTLVGGAIEGVTGLIEEQQAAAAQLKSDLISAYQSAAEEGRLYLDQAQIIAAATRVLFDPDQTKMDAYERKAAQIGVTAQTYLLAQSGSWKDLQIVVEATEQAYATAGQVGEDKSKSGQAAALAEKRAIEAIIFENERLIAIHEQGKAAAQADQAIRDALSQRERDQIKRTSDADQARWDALAERYEYANGLPPIDIKTTLEIPDVDGAYNEAQRKANGKVVTFQSRVVNRDGHVVG